MKAALGEDFGSLEALLKAVSADAAIKAKFVAQRNAFIEQKKQSGGASLRSFTVQRSAFHEQGETMRAEGPKYDFWEPAWYTQVHGAPGDVCTFFYRGQEQEGVWKRATEAMLPYGVICRATWEEFQTSATKTVSHAEAHEAGALPVPPQTMGRPDLALPMRPQPQNSAAVPAALPLPLADQEPAQVPEGPFKDVYAMVCTMLQLSKPPEKASVVGVEKECRGIYGISLHLGAVSKHLKVKQPIDNQRFTQHVCDRLLIIFLAAPN